LRIELHLLRIQHVLDIEIQLNKDQLKKLKAYKQMEMQEWNRCTHMAQWDLMSHDVSDKAAI
jgi:hypothetical protein